MIDRLISWAVNSTAFKKWNGIIGGFCLGMWVSANYWREIKETREAWGVSFDSWTRFLIAVVGASGIAFSIGLSAVKQHRAKGTENGDDSAGS